MPDATALTNIMKLVDYVVHVASLKGYRFSNGQVYERVIVRLEGTVHETPYWNRVTKSEQTRESSTESRPSHLIGSIRSSSPCARRAR